MPIRSRVFVSRMFATVSSLACIFAACGGEVESPTRTRFDPGGGGDVRIDASNPSDGGSDGDTIDASEAGPDVDVPDTGPLDELAPITEIDLGTVANGTTHTFRVGPNTLGVQILAQASTPQIVGISDIFAPDGTVVSKDFIPTKGTFGTQIGTDGLGAASIPVQNLPVTMPTVAEGDWTASFFNDDATPIQARVKTLQTDDGRFHGGTLDIHLWIPDGLQMSDGDQLVPVTIAGGAAQTTVKTRLDSFYALLEKTTGIGRGTVTLHALPSPFRTLEGEDGADELVPLLKSSSAVGEQRAMHFFWVESSPNLSWWGIASGIPGAAQSPGTPLADIVLATIDQAPPEYEGSVMLHEMGHFIGLQHPTEFDDFGEDPLEDTPVCPNLTFNNYQNCPDGNNVMFAAGALDLNAVATSPLQTNIFRSSFVYKALRRDPQAPLPSPTPTRSLFTKKARFGAWSPQTPLATLLAGGCAHQHLPKTAQPSDIAGLRALAANRGAPAFVRERARRMLPGR
jgi:hypothetical protein